MLLPVNDGSGDGDGDLTMWPLFVDMMVCLADIPSYSLVSCCVISSSPTV